MVNASLTDDAVDLGRSRLLQHPAGCGSCHHHSTDTGTASPQCMLCAYVVCATLASRCAFVGLCVFWEEVACHECMQHTAAAVHAGYISVKAASHGL